MSELSGFSHHPFSKKAICLSGIALLFSLMIPLLPGWNFFLSHLLFFLVLFFCFFKTKLTVRDWLCFTIVVSFFLFNMFFSLRHGSDGRFLQDSIKLMLFGVGLFLYVKFFSGETTVFLLSKMLIFFAIFYFYYLIFVNDEPLFSYSGRLFVPLFGSPNVNGVFCGLSLLFLVRFKRFFNKYIFLLLIVFYSSVLVLGFSRAAIIGFIVAFSLLIKGRYFLMFLIFVFILSILALVFNDQYEFIPDWVFSKGDVVTDIQETGGSYRTIVWSVALDRFLGSPLNFLFGEGVSRVISVDLPRFSVNHPHNFYIFIALSYGVLALVVFLIFWLHRFILIISMFSSGGDRFYLAIIVFYSLIFLMDTHVLSSQYLIQHIMFLSLLFRKNMGKPLCSLFMRPTAMTKTRWRNGIA